MSSRQRARRTRRERRREGRPRAPQARRADVFDLYEQAVQDPPTDVAFVRRVFRNHFGREPRRLREDFCGTAALCCEWVRTHAANRAWGIDLDPAPLESGRRRHLARLAPEQAARVELLQGDVREVSFEPVDVTVAFNFSYFVFQERRELVAYFEHARKTLRPEGLLVLDLYGGADAQRTLTETRDHESFEYVWDQDVFDPIHHRAVNYIHFEFPDGSRIQRAFRYDWRLWTIPELRDALHDAGFSAVEAYWERTDRKTNEGTGVYYRAARAPDDPAWVAYLAALP